MTGPNKPGGAAVNRRGFLKTLLGLSFVITAGGVLTPVLGYIWPPKMASGSAGERVLVGTTEDLPVGKGKVVSYNNKPVIVLNTAEGVKAFSAICTHLRCIVHWHEEGGYILCPCHDGRFDTNGRVISGPPPAPLPPVPAFVEGDKIYVGGA